MGRRASGQSYRRLRSASRVAFWVCVIAIAFFSPLNILFYTDFYRNNGLWLILPAAAAVAAALALASYIMALSLGQAQVSREFDAWLAGSGDSRPIILFLRSFDMAKSGLLQRALKRFGKAFLLIPYALSADGREKIMGEYLAAEIQGPTGSSAAEKELAYALGSAIYDVEEELDDAIDSRALFVAIGDKRVSYGAAKIHVRDEDWQALFGKLTEAAVLIFMMPGVSSAVLWEMSQVVGTSRLLSKTMFIMPRHGPVRSWATLADAAASQFGVQLPRYDANGCYFRLLPQGGPAETVGLEAFTRSLEAHIRANAVGGTIEAEELWRSVEGLKREQVALASWSQPHTASEWAQRVALTGYVEDGEALIRDLGGSVRREKAGRIFATTRITVRVFDTERSFNREYDMVQWIIREVVPRASGTTAPAAVAQ